MAQPRTKLSEKLKEILGNDNVYYRAPTRMNYPCIKYSKENVWVSRAGNKVYAYRNQYLVTFIHQEPEEEIFEKLLNFPYSSYSNNYISDGLIHDVFTIYF